MKTIRCFGIYAIIIASLLLHACDDNEIQPHETGALTLRFDNRAGNSDLQLNTAYTNASGETFSLTTFNYYISNIRLGTTDGKEYVVPQDSSYS